MKELQTKKQSASSSIKLVLHPLGLLSLGTLIAIAALEVGSSQVRHIFGTYPVSISLLTFLITLIFTLSVVNRFIEKRAERLWEDIRGITLKGLNDEVRSTRDILWIALFGQPPYGLTQQTIHAFSVAEHSSITWETSTLGHAGTCLASMVADRQWTKTASEILRLATQQIREGLVRWAPMTALARGDYHALSPVARLADVLEALEFPFAAPRIDRGSGCIDSRFRAPVQVLWLHAITACIYVEEIIVRVLHPKDGHSERPGEWTSKARELVSGDEICELDRWLRDVTAFEMDTSRRQSTLMAMVDWPW
jgi:hypothetical protein